jgi:hypothetical protein
MASLRGGMTSGTEEVRLRQLMSQLMPRIRHRGSTVKADWLDFSHGQTVTKAQFDRILRQYDVPWRQGDFDILWGNIGVPGSAMGYSEFARFCSLQDLDPSLAGRAGVAAAPREAAEDAPLPLAALLVHGRRQLVAALLEGDPEVDGFAAAADVAAAIAALGACSEQEVARLIGNYDPLGTGTLNYFSLMADICHQASGAVQSAPARHNGRLGTALPRGGARPPPSAPATVTFADDEDDEDDSPPSQKVGNQERLQGLIKTLSREVTRAYDSAQVAWQRWRGGSQTLMADDFARNANQACKMDMTAEEAQALIQMMGGTLTLGKFVQLLGSASIESVQSQAVKDAADEDPNDKWLLHCARQIASHPGKSEKWEYILTHCPNIEMGLAQLKRVCDVIVDPNEFRPVWRALGAEEVIARIGRFVETCGGG